MLLYYNKGGCSLSPHIVLHETGLPHAVMHVDLHSGRTADGTNYWAINPKRSVPALRLDDGAVLTEGAAIVQYIADRAPEWGLVPKAGTMERYRVQEWLNYVGTEMHRGFTPLFSADIAPEWKAKTLAALAQKFDFLSERLAGRVYLMGDGFTVADAYLFVILRWCDYVAVDLSGWPALTDYMERVGARPAVQAAMRVEGLTT